jgi:A/G-specific adenine glycosylase
LDSKAFRTALIGWYKSNRRELPWRETNDPFLIWVSEIMLQQTQVNTVIPYFQRFVQVFPNLAALKRATQQDVLSVWQGLGYYRRAKNLLAAAKSLKTVPNTFSELLALPGIGRYTAAAIASIAFGERCAVVDGNVERVISRLCCIDESGSKLKRKCETVSQFAMSDVNPGDWNQALMELGATICRPLEPRCDKCPVAKFCNANRTASQSKYPMAKPTAKPIKLIHACVCPVHQGKVGLCKVASGQWWDGMWQFPRTEVEASETPLAAAERLGFADLKGLLIVKHSVTRYSITLHSFVAKLKNQRRDLKWFGQDSISELPMPAPQRKVAEALRQTVIST